MTAFSKRNGYNQDGIQPEFASDVLKRRIFARFYKQEFNVYDTLKAEKYTTGVEDMMIEMGLTYEFPENSIYKTRNVEKLEKLVTQSSEWYLVFDFIEKYLAISNEDTANYMQNEFNRILTEEVSAYRIVDKMVVPITNEMEIDTIVTAKETEFDAVNNHISKALSLYADRRNPDYENSIKESISAVESLCCIITQSTGKNAVLSKAIKKLKDKGITIHPLMENAYLSLYNYTSDEDGVRHGGIEIANIQVEDAKYMLVSCSAFVNYLIEKWSKATKQET